ncbi:hypothetical protein OJAV_G00201900 [Oryzias javanicus]|uniref:Uncharacterized protein n=1 Tax=Oryzias javanicus TaxID=123683 RepID=A0A437C542_ORYJA|nr:hypothetical protein OJAV_G00201900 [Oryzias javanicus]
MPAEGCEFAEAPPMRLHGSVANICCDTGEHICIRTGVREVEIRCPLNHIQCIGTKKCIHFNKLCNGARDCEDGFDEGVHCRGRNQNIIAQAQPG